ncbi:hypothetical protein LK540_13380 [Massilia sp. IC2-278]|uniref:YmfL family putative regulatory protein n=1 Tax=Massilia sp. IC2-278 TaxID=2887200 RepID=UPI001E4A8B9C|nr:YmfL family putative regulatory protein [Massilia sp. IC2-278]MCC2961415.1 hypothetical protein [Massilia sp. IC2-278]
MDLRNAKLKMIAAAPGGWDVAATYLGLTVAALRNRAYEVKGQVLTDEHSLALQRLSGTTFYAEAIAAASGGMFVQLPDDPLCDDVDLMKKFQDLYAELGTFSSHFREAVEDDNIDSRERALLEEDAARMQRVIGELVKLMVHVYAPHSGQEGT